MVKASTHSQTKKVDSPVTSFILFLILAFFVFWIINSIIQSFTSFGNKYSDSEAQEQTFWESQREADEGARKAQDYEQEQKLKQAH